MFKMPNSPDDRRNRIGCFIILAILGGFVALYLFVGFSAEPGNNMTEDIPTVPGPRR